jgi:flavorubredoxin
LEADIVEKVEIKPGVYWVGVIDWDLRDFHGYTTDRGTTYNAYLIVDEKIVLVDTVKRPFFDEMLSRIKEIVDPAKIDYIIANHVEMDHSGSLPKMLVRHYKKELNVKTVESGDTLQIGKRTLHFVHIPMVHWPDSMVTYVQEDKLLLPNDAFGQHVATPERFDDEFCWDILREEAAKYYANIVLPFGGQVAKAMEVLSGLDIDMIAPSHGIIWRTWLPRILEEYKKWSSDETENKAVIVYDTMWGSTGMIARKLEEGLKESGIPTMMRHLKVSHISDVMTDILTSKLVLIGSPTINNGMLASVGGFLTYLRGLKPLKRTALAFGSYGWSGQAVGQIEDIVKEIKWEVPAGSVKIKFIPDEDELEKVKQIGVELGRKVKE